MPEINTPVPILRKDIRKGDRIRQTFEYTATEDGSTRDAIDATYRLVDRPVVLPTEPGIYADRTGHPWRVNSEGSFENGQWFARPWDDDELRSLNEKAPFTLLRPAPEVAAEVLAAVLFEFKAGGWISYRDNLYTVATQYGVTL